MLVKTIEIREATTRIEEITCKDKNTGDPFDFTGYTVRTWISFGDEGVYVPTTIVNNVLSYEIPAAASLGAKRGVAETRIFKGDRVYEVLRMDIRVAKAEKPDLTPSAESE